MTAPVSVAVLLDQLDAARAAATPGVWGTPVAPTWIHRAEALGHVGTTEHPADAACIVAEHNASPRLVAAVRAEWERHRNPGDGFCRYDGLVWPCIAHRELASALAEEGA